MCPRALMTRGSGLGQGGGGSLSAPPLFLFSRARSGGSEGESMREKRNAEASSLAASASRLARTHGITRDQARRLIKKLESNRTKFYEAVSVLKARFSSRLGSEA